MLKKLLENGKAIALLPSLSLFVGAVFLGLYGIYVLFETLYKVLTDQSARDTAVLATKFISVMDIHLLSVILYIFAVGLYELFVGELKLAPWLKIETIDQLKSKLASVIVLILAITFTKNLVEWKNPLDTLLFGLAVSAVIGVLIFYYKIKSEH
ncbi:YqhA family protein [Thermocrinis jamiesonii]|jgi:Predicted membrane protein|uniref:YqhA family protein n=1 Tax=Thermocrinis jamiesonii TaxID=1302351 RepID=UPI0004954FAF|nr:YqhA family protein [Thermocrinis jamiesonii]